MKKDNINMTLPIIKSTESTFNLEIPSNKKTIQFRRMKISDEKILLFAKESEDNTDIYNAVLQVIQNCIITPNIKIDDLTLFDIEFLFLNLRGQSVNNIIQLSITDREDNTPYEFNINIPDIKVYGLKDNTDMKIELSTTEGIIMKYPPASIYQDKEFLKSNDASYDKLMIKCIDKIYDKENIYKASEYKEDELLAWINDLEIKNYNKISDFISNLPVVKYEIKYKNKLSNERTITLATLNDFFMLR